MKIAIGAGHGGNDPGAVYGENNEAWLARQITPVMQQMSDAVGNTTLDITSNAGYPGNINNPVMAANSWGADLAIQNHFNAGGGTGVEVLYWFEDSAAGELAARISAAISNVYGIPNRGAKARGSELGFLRDTNMTALIIEWGFVDAPNNSDVPKIMGDLSGGAKAAIEAIGGKVPEPVPTPTPDPEPTKELYRVRKTWDDANSQKGAFAFIDNALRAREDANEYHVFDANGNIVA